MEATPPSDRRSPDFLAGGGAMGALVRAHDWERTPLGAPDGWPDALAMSTSICLGSRFPMVLWWGPQLIVIYNDAWRPVLGASKHPAALGSPGHEVWAEIWDIIGPQLEAVLHTGAATWSEDLLLPMDRNGYLEEAYFTYSYSPIRHVDGTIGGVFTAVSETTERVLGERRLRSLRELAERTAEAKSVAATCEAFAEVLGGGVPGAANPDLPFALLYLVDGDAARLAATSGFAAADPAVPSPIRLAGAADADDPWGVARAIRSEAVVELRGLDQRPGAALPGGVWPEAARAALVLPVARSGAAHEVAGALVVGVNPRRALDDAYRGFLDLVAGSLATALASAQAYEAERRRAEALAELDRAKTQFFSNVSHEFRTPLTLMLGPLEDALAAALPPGPREHLEVAHRNALRLLKLVNSLLDFSRIEAGRIQASREPVDLAALTADLASSFRSAIERAGMTLTVDCPPLDEAVPVDREMWEKVVLNLLSNAFKFTFEGGITVALAKRDGFAELSVRDTGTGIPEHELPRLFERFHRVAGARGRTFEGSGIGLALVQELLRLHQGWLRADSEVGRGSTFTAAVPLGAAPVDLAGASPPSEASTATRAEAFVAEALRWLPSGSGAALADAMVPDAASPALGAPDGAGARVLLADDNGDMREYLQRLLVQRGYVVDAHADGAAALAAALEAPPDLVLSDVMMPVLDGFGLLRGLRDDPALRDVPVILLSARAGQEATSEGLDAGADDYLVKPFSARELLARVGTHLAMARVRREASVAARLRAAELEALLEAVPVGLWFTRDADAATVHGNRAAARLLRMEHRAGGAFSAPLPERPGHFRAFRDGIEVAPGDLPLQRAARGEAVAADEVEVRFDDGRVAVLLCRALPITSPDGTPAGAVCSATDITERKQAEQALRSSHGALQETVEQRTRELQKLFTLSGDLFCTAGFDGMLKAVNPAWTHALGHDEATLLGRPYAELIHPEDRERVGAFVKRLQRGEPPVTFEDRLLCRDGGHRWFSWSIVAEGGLMYAVGRDTTQERLHLEELAAANRQLVAQIEERERVEATLRQLQRLDAIGQLTSGVAHDFNNLLTVVLGNVEALGASEAARADAKFARRLDMVRTAATRGAKLTAQLLAFSRRQKLEARPVDLNDAVVGMRELLQTTVGGSVRIEVDLHPALGPALVDATQLELVILNLAINARDAMPAGGSLLIETAPARVGPPQRAEEPAAGDYLMVAVTDTGTGMTEEVRARVFEPFFTTKEVGKGSGLGLAQVFGFAKQSGGGLRIDTTPGHGTSVRVYLPAAAARSEAAPSTAASRAGAGTPSATILLVDDDSAVREVALLMLEAQGYLVLAAGSGGAALDLLDRAPQVALLLVDYAMPGMSGVELARLAGQRRPGLPIMFMTGYVDAVVLGDVDEARIIRKPFHEAELAGKLAALLQGSAAMAAAG